VPLTRPRRKSRVPGPARSLVQLRQLAHRVSSWLEYRELTSEQRVWGEALLGRLERSIEEAKAAAIPTDPRDGRKARKRKPETLFEAST
jgi:hypothetical protein